MKIREYVDDYSKYYPEKWSWKLSDSLEQHDLYMSTRARRCKDYLTGGIADLLPDFYSIERDAAQFGLKHVVWTDFFGLEWEGKKGVIANAGAPDFKGSLYYYSPNDDYADEEGYCISEEYDAYRNQPPAETYTKLSFRGVGHWIDTVNVKDATYKYLVDNHLFKDTYIELIYKDGEKTNVISDYKALITGLLHCGNEKLVKKILKSMNEHFIKLRDSDREEIREFYPGKTAEEMFLE